MCEVLYKHFPDCSGGTLRDFLVGSWRLSGREAEFCGEPSTATEMIETLFDCLGQVAGTRWSTL